MLYLFERKTSSVCLMVFFNTILQSQKYTIKLSEVYITTMNCHL